jgi:hypothetical protein
MSLFNLESKKILLDFQYAKEELNIKKEMIEQMDGLFNKAVSDYLKNNNDLKSKWDNYLKKSDENISKILDLQKFEGEIHQTVDSKSDKQFEYDLEIEPEIEPNIDKPDDIFFKQVYREIVKKSHPDKIRHLSEEEFLMRSRIYLDATIAYEKKSLADILYCAYVLKIAFEIKKEDLKSLKDSLSRCKMESQFLEKTYTWQWYHANDDVKSQLINSFVSQQVK